MTVGEYQVQCSEQYKKSIGYPEEFNYFYGNPIRVAVPVETPLNKVMVIAPMPSAKFYTVNGVADVPLYDNDAPLADEHYFDGTRVKLIPTSMELSDLVLKRVGIKRRDCWATYLVKTFLFKKGHIDRYQSLGKTDVYETRSKFHDYAELSKKWIEEEIRIAQPYVVILLGLEVTSTIFGVTESVAEGLMNGLAYQHTIGNEPVNIMALPSSYMLLRKGKQNPWTEKFYTKVSQTARKELAKLRGKTEDSLDEVFSVSTE